MSGIRPEDIILACGGFCYPKYGTFTRRTTSAFLGGDNWKETIVRADADSRRVGRQGLSLPVPADQLRLGWFDPNDTGANDFPGVLIERAVENKAVRSAEFDNVAWFTDGLSSVSANADTGIFGGTTVDRLIEDSGSGQHEVFQDITVTASRPLVLGAAVRPDSTRPKMVLSIVDSTNRFGVLARAFWDVSTATLENTQTAGGATVTRTYVEPTIYRGGIRRYWLIANIGAITTASVEIGMYESSSNVTYTGDGSSYLALAHAQFSDEADQPFGTSVIATLGSTVATVADNLTVPYFAEPQSMQAYVRFIELGTVFSVDFSRIIQIGESTTTGRFMLFRQSGIDRYQGDMYRTDGDVSSSAIGTGSIAIGDTVELLATATEARQFLLQQRINGGAIVSGGLGTAITAFPASWGTERAIRIGSGTGHYGLNALINTRSASHSMDEFAAFVDG